MTALLLSGCASNVTTPISSTPAYIFGVYAPGHNITEPRPQKSQYLQVETGGVVVLENGAGLFLNTRVLKHPENELYITVEYEDPAGTPLFNDAPFYTDAKYLNFSVPNVQSGLKSYSDYQITIRIWEMKGSEKPLDTLIQKVRSYVDTTGSTPLVFNKLKQK